MTENRKIQIGRYRWTDDEKREAFAQLLEDSAILPEQVEKPKPKVLLISDTIEEAAKRLQTGGEIVGVRSGYYNLDSLTKGFAPGELITIFGHTSHGKSQLVQNIIYNAGLSGTASLLISLEMTLAETTGRFMKIAKVDPTRMEDFTSFLSLPIMYPASREVRAEDIDPLVAEAVSQGIGLVAIDHLHYFGRSIVNPHEEIGLLVNEFKRVAVKYDVPIILISHIVKLAQEVWPQPYHLRGSSFIGQDSDQLISVFREVNENSMEQTLGVAMWKNRNRGYDPARNKIELIIRDDVRLEDSVPLPR